MPEELNREVHELTENVERLRLELHKTRQADRRTARRVIAAIGAVGALTVGGAYGLILHDRHVADHRWCGLFGVLTTDTPPPTTDRGRAVAAELKRLHGELGC